MTRRSAEYAARVVSRPLPLQAPDGVRPDPAAWRRSRAARSPRDPVRRCAPATLAAASSAPRAGGYAPRRVHHVPERLRAQGRLRRHVPRRDQAHRAGGGDHRHHPRDPADVDPAGRARAREHDRVHARRRPPRDRRSRRGRAATAARAARRRGAAVRRAGQRAAAAGGEPRRHRGGARAREPRVRARVDLADVPRARSLRARLPRTSRTASRSRSSARRSIPTASCGSTSRSPWSSTARSSATLLYVDSFGNIALNLDRDDVESARHRLGNARRARARAASATTR